MQDAETDPTFDTMAPFLRLPSSVAAGVAWAGNGVATDTCDALDKVDRFAATKNTPLAMYRGADSHGRVCH